MGGEGRLSPHRPHPPTPAPVFLKVPSRQHQAPLSQKHAPMHILSGCLVQVKRSLSRKVLSGARQTPLLEKAARVLSGGPPAEPGPAHHFRPAWSAIDIGRGAGQESEKYIYHFLEHISIPPKTHTTFQVSPKVTFRTTEGWFRF